MPTRYEPGFGYGEIFRRRMRAAAEMHRRREEMLRGAPEWDRRHLRYESDYYGLHGAGRRHRIHYAADYRPPERRAEEREARAYGREYEGYGREYAGYGREFEHGAREGYEREAPPAARERTALRERAREARREREERRAREERMAARRRRAAPALYGAEFEEEYGRMPGVYGRELVGYGREFSAYGEYGREFSGERERRRITGPGPMWRRTEPRRRRR